MTALTKLLIGTALSLILSLETSGTIRKNTISTSPKKLVVRTIGTRPHQILKNNYNTCRMKRHKRCVFTPENMTPQVPDPYDQFFIKRSMPKGIEAKLTDKEYQELVNCITSTQNEI